MNRVIPVIQHQLQIHVRVKSVCIAGDKMANHLSESLSEQTFQYQNSLPPLPVPSLESSLSKYLDAGRIVNCVLVIVHCIMTNKAFFFL